MKSRSIRTLAVLASAGLIVGAFAAGPADAAKKKKKKPVPACAEFAPPPVASGGTTGSQAIEAEVAQLTTAHTEEAPLIIEFEHGPAFWDTATHSPVQEDTKYFGIQLPPGIPQSGLYARIDWATPSPSDIDLYLYDDTGTEVEHSGALNVAPVPNPVLDLSDRGNGGMGYESISGLPVDQCNGFVVESQAFLTPGEAMTLTLYLGEIAAPAAE